MSKPTALLLIPALAALFALNLGAAEPVIVIADSLEVGRWALANGARVETEELVVPSPFDFKRHAVLYTPTAGLTSLDALSTIPRLSVRDRSVRSSH